MAFNSETGLDPCSQARIREVLPKDSDATPDEIAARHEGAIIAIEWIAFRYHKPSLAKADHDRREKLLDDLDRLAHDLNVERYSVYHGDEGAVIRQACSALWAAREQVERRRDEYHVFHRRGHDARRDILYGELLHIWVVILGGGRPTISRTGPCADYLITVVFEITGELLAADALPDLIRRWYASIRSWEAWAKKREIKQRRYAVIERWAKRRIEPRR